MTGDSGITLVVGATGTQGSAVVDGLLSRRLAVRALTRRPHGASAERLRGRGVEVVAGDTSDQASLLAAFEGVGAVYAITTPFESGADAEVRQGEAIIAAAQEAAVPWFVLASVAAADRAAVPHFASKARIEERLRSSQLPWTIVAPSYFYENVASAAVEAQTTGQLALPLSGGTPLHQVGLENFGSVVASVVTRKDEHLGERVEVAGDAPTPSDMASAIGARFVAQGLESVYQRSPDIGAMYEFLEREGYGIDVSAVRRRYPEVAWASFDSWATSLLAKLGG